MFHSTRSFARRSSSMAYVYGAVRTGGEKDRPFAEIVARPLDRSDCDRSGYITLHKASEHAFINRNRLYRSVDVSEPCANIFAHLKQLNSDYFTFITTIRTQFEDNIYAVKWRHGFTHKNTLLRVQLLHVGNSSYSTRNEILYEEEPDIKLATVTHHVTLVDPAARRPVKMPDTLVDVSKNHALSASLPYRVELGEPNDVHRYSTTVRWSDTDAYQHLNTLCYLKMALDVVYDAVGKGKFRSYIDEEGTFRVDDFQMRFMREVLQGQIIDMELWQGPVGVLNLRMKVDGNIVNESLLMSKDHPSHEAPIPSQL